MKPPSRHRICHPRLGGFGSGSAISHRIQPHRWQFPRPSARCVMLGGGAGASPLHPALPFPAAAGPAGATDPSAGESGAEPAGRLSPPSAHTSSIGADSHSLAAPTAPPTARHGSARARVGDASRQPPKSGSWGEPRVRGAGSPIKPSGRETSGFGIQADTRGGVRAGLWVQVRAAPLIWGVGSPVGQDTGRSTSPGDPGIPTGTERGQPHRSGTVAASLVRGYELPWGSGRRADPRVQVAMDVGGALGLSGQTHNRHPQGGIRRCCRARRYSDR